MNITTSGQSQHETNGKEVVIDIPHIFRTETSVSP